MQRAARTIATTFILAAATLAPTSAAAAASNHSRHRHGAPCVNGNRRQADARQGGRCPKSPHSARPRPHSQAKRPHAVSPRPRPRRTPVPTSPATSAQATIAAVLATPCENTELTPEPANLALVRAAVLCLVNHERAAHGESPLALNPDLQQAAEAHAEELVRLNYFAHVSPSGLTPVQRIRETGYLPGPSFGYVIGENLAWGTLSLATAQSIVSAWIASPGHLANILEAQYQDTGVAVYPAVPPSLGGGQSGATYAQEFGVLLG